MTISEAETVHILLTRYVKAFNGPDKTNKSIAVATCQIVTLVEQQCNIQKNQGGLGFKNASHKLLQTTVFLPAATPHLIEEITIGNEKKHPK